MFESPRKDQFTQGTIFSCAYAENYPDIPAYGLVITARCDAAQKKVPIYSFIPVVSIRDWMFEDGAEIILRRQIQELNNSLENILDALELSPSVLRTTPTSDIIDNLLKPLAEKDRKAATRIQKFMESAGHIADIEAALSAGHKDGLKGVLPRAAKIVDQVLKELAGNRLTGHYLLRSMPTVYGTEPTNHVALLREVHHVPNDLAHKIMDGISRDEWMIQPPKGVCCPVFCQEEDFCMPVAKLRSPWMEHLMQSWSMLFARIGVEDVDVAAVKKSLDGLGLGAA